jgi:hypothetical protein
MPVNAARKLLGAEAIIGYSTHNLDQVREALNCRSTTWRSGLFQRAASRIRIPSLA